jgi:hypothetical protein
MAWQAGLIRHPSKERNNGIFQKDPGLNPGIYILNSLYA